MALSSLYRKTVISYFSSLWISRWTIEKISLFLSFYTNFCLLIHFRILTLKDLSGKPLPTALLNSQLTEQSERSLNSPVSHFSASSRGNNNMRSGLTSENVARYVLICIFFITDLEDTLWFLVKFLSKNPLIKIEVCFDGTKMWMFPVLRQKLDQAPNSIFQVCILSKENRLYID